jgi:hypothetical protein
VSAIIVDTAYRLSTMSDCQLYVLFVFICRRRLLSTAAGGDCIYDILYVAASSY